MRGLNHTPDPVNPLSLVANGNTEPKSFVLDPLLARNLPRDKWLLSSLMQKAIRRGRVDYAVAAAASLTVTDPAYVARRLPVVAYEEIGIANSPLLLWIRQVAATLVDLPSEDRQSHAMSMAGLQAESNKSRSHATSFLFSNARPLSPPRLPNLRTCPFKHGLRWPAMFEDQLLRRIIAFHFIMGLSCHGVKPGRFAMNARLAAMTSIAETMHLPLSVQIAIRKGRQTPNLNTALGLAHQLVYGTCSRLVTDESLQTQSPAVGGILLCAADQYTRIGRDRIALSGSADLRQLLRDHAPRGGDPYRHLSCWCSMSKVAVCVARSSRPQALRFGCRWKRQKGFR